jgi:hypothetical protein
MPRQTQDVLSGYQFNVLRVEVPVAGEDGLPIHDGMGVVKVQEETRIVFVCPATQHVVIVPLPEAAREELIRQLTGGIVVAGMNGGT